MAKSEIENIKERLQKAISVLEAQTTMLKKDLARLSELGLGEESEEVAQQVEATKEQIGANEEVIEKVKSTKAESLVSDLEREAVGMLERMQQKIQAQEILSGLYEKEIKDVEEVAESENSGEAEAVEEKSQKESDEEFFKDIEMESLVDKLKKQDALETFKKKMGLK
ncbi:hypothetical protein R9C00_01830 [Flammeovirgaceae bacterium SG7u.111]|nr:hypothetical protein [Flammeovirgaceae bacterium SG7u.132]WPO36182.1 hypothetical protein R9C00_01830 [Flammeovirgaceae bacterium SG7u.111]